MPLDLQPSAIVVVVRRLVANTEARASREHAGGDVHSEQLLEEKLGGVRDVDLGDACLVVTGTALVFALLELAVFMLAWYRSRK